LITRISRYNSLILEGNINSIKHHKNNSSLEAIVLYLKDVSKMRYSQIAQLLNRDQRTIWSHMPTPKKKAMHLELGDDIQLSIPASIFTSRNFSILESIVFYLKIDHALTFNQISELLGKNYRTIWTVYRRALANFQMNKDEQ